MVLGTTCVGTLLNTWLLHLGTDASKKDDAEDAENGSKIIWHWQKCNQFHTLEDYFTIAHSHQKWESQIVLLLRTMHKIVEVVKVIAFAKLWKRDKCLLPQVTLLGLESELQEINWRRMKFLIRKTVVHFFIGLV